MSDVKYFSPKCYADVILSLSIKMQVSASAQDWETTQELEQQRNLILEQLFAHPEITQALPSLAATLEKVIEIDTLVIEEGENELKLMSSKLQQFGQGKRAVNAYLEPH